jgi:hypothetical protein
MCLLVLSFVFSGLTVEDFLETVVQMLLPKRRQDGFEVSDLDEELFDFHPNFAY